MKKIVIRGKQYPFSFNMGAIKLFMKKKGLTKMSELEPVFASMQNTADMSIDAIDDIVLLILCSIEFACRVERIEFDLIPEDIEDEIMSDADRQNEIFEMIGESFDTGNNEAGTVEASEPKKGTINDLPTSKDSQSGD